MAKYFCRTCQKPLDRHPKIELDGYVFCYRCAKQTVGNIDARKKIELEPKLRAYEAKRACYDEWHKNFEAAKPDKESQNIVVLCVTIGTLFFFSDNCKKDSDYLAALFLGFVIGQIAKLYYIKWKKDEWVRQNPQPAYPEYPASDFASERIKLIGGGTKGKQITGAYRTQILERDGYQCQCCGKVFPAEELEVHHVKARSKRGKNFSTNLVTLCFDCHLDEDWFEHSHYMRRWFR